MDPVRGGWVIFCKGNVIWEKTLLMTHGPMQWKWVVLERVHTGCFFFNWYPPKKLKYGKPRLGVSTLTYVDRPRYT